MCELRACANRSKAVSPGCMIIGQMVAVWGDRLWSRTTAGYYTNVNATIELREPLTLHLDGEAIGLHEGAEATFYYNPQRTAGLIKGRTFCTIFDYEGEVQISIGSDGRVTKRAIPVRTRPRVPVGA